MSGAPGFDRRRALVLAGAAVASLVAAGALGVYGDALSEPPSVAADGYSRSAIGHRAFAAFLRALGREVIVSRHATAAKVAAGGVLVVAEPSLPEDAAEAPRAAALAAELRDAGAPLLLVLPKRTGLPDRTGRWLATSTLRPQADAQRVLDRFGVDAIAVRPARAGPLSGVLPAPGALDAPQLLRSGALRPLLASDEGMLAGELVDEETGARLVVLADPDPIANHGLGRGDAPLLAAALLARLGPSTAPVVIDETLHGHELQPSVARELLRFPLVLATAQALLAGALLAWAALVRFGRPRRPAPALAAGKEVLLDSTAALLLVGGSPREAVRGYLAAAKERLAHRLRPPGSEEPAAAWLARTARARGRGEALSALEAAAEALPEGPRAAEAAVRTAQEIHRFTEEMTHGARRDP